MATDVLPRCPRCPRCGCEQLKDEIKQLKTLLKTTKSYMRQAQVLTRAWPAEKLMDLFHEINKATWDDENGGEE